MSEGFIIDPWIGMVFFRFCRQYNVQNKEKRILLMRELVRRKKAKYLRDVKPLLVGKKVLKVGFKSSHNPYDSHYCPECGSKELQ